MNYERKDAIDRFIENKLNYRGEQRHRIGGKIVVMKTYEINIELLRFNEENGRIYTAKHDLEKELGHKLSCDNKDHDEYFIKMLTEDKEDTEKLKVQMKDVGQEHAGLITADGIIINGNRRCAIKKLLKQKTMLVSVLNSNISKSELYDIEFSLQVADDFKKEYKGIDRLFMIQRGIESGKTPEDMKKLFGVTVTEINEAKEVLDKIERFLEFVGEDGNYSLVSNMLEHFKDGIKELNKIERAGIDTFDTEEIFYNLMSLNICDEGNKVAHRDIRDTLFFSAIDEKINKALTRNIFDEQSTEEDILNDLAIAKELAKSRKNQESIINTIKKLIGMIRGANIENADYYLENGGYSIIINYLQEFDDTANAFIEEVTNEANSRVSFEAD